MITLVNYGLGNIQAFFNIYSQLNIPVKIASTPSELYPANRIILPGVGSFDWAMQRLNKSGMREILDDLVLVKHVPVLGICVGMQMLARSSDEGRLSGLGWLNATVRRFGTTHLPQKTLLPHMGWNDAEPVRETPLFANMNKPRFYFLHSYYFVPADEHQTIAVTQYGDSFASAVAERNIYGVQFHPEKSHRWGMQVLENFARV